MIDDVQISKDSMCSFGDECGNSKVLRAGTRGQHGDAAHTARKVSTVYTGPEPQGRRALKASGENTQLQTKQRTPQDQLDALWSLHDQLGGASGRWRRSHGWVRGQDPCDPDGSSWYGVGCFPVTDVTMPGLYRSSLGGITAVLLAGNGLHGDISGINLSPLREPADS